MLLKFGTDVGLADAGLKIVGPTTVWVAQSFQVESCSAMLLTCAGTWLGGGVGLSALLRLVRDSAVELLPGNVSRRLDSSDPASRPISDDSVIETSAGFGTLT